MRRHQKTHFVATATSAIALATCITPINAHDDHQNRDDITRGEAHPTIMDTTRFFTNRDGAALNLPTEDEAFTFAIFGDRTGGPADGINVLKDAVHDVNIMEPDFVMTVGDMIQGYNQTDAWMDQMREFKGVMDELLCPWFPVAGNHDIYWRGPDKPAGEHEASYEVHFGPLWYSFEHKDCHFIVLYTDEGNPDTGRKSIREPEAQRMSPEQLSWLESALEHANDAQHVFVFVHHPRWLKGNYGNDWKNVHAKLVDAGNVRAVFAGHIHRMRYDGVKDGIEYVTLATVGGHNDFSSPEAGYLHHMNLITVRPHQIAMSAIPVGEVMDVRAITGDVSDAASMLARSQPTVDDVVRIRTDGASDGRVRVTVRNPTGGTVDVAMYPDSDDARWTFVPDHQHGTINAEGEMAFDFEVQRNPGAIDDSFHPIALVQRMDYLTDDARYAIPERRIDVP
ncbi:MAG: metallophosphoesterase, partial [Planctomycetota bacterium]